MMSNVKLTGSRFSESVLNDGFGNERIKMIKAEIKISGPGGTISGPLSVILKALQDAGALVTVTDAYPPPEAEYLIERKLTGWNIEIITNHYPWGG